MNKFMKWRLMDPPKAEDIVALLAAGVIKPDEARQIIFTEDGQNKDD